MPCKRKCGDAELVTVLAWLLIDLLPFSPAPPGLARIPLSQLGKNSRRAYLCWNQLHRRADGEVDGMCLHAATDDPPQLDAPGCRHTSQPRVDGIF